MSEWKRILKQWSPNIIECVGVTVAVSLALMILFGVEVTALLKTFPYFIFMAGGFMIFMTISGIFQSYISVLISFNSRRLAAMAGVLYFTVGSILAICGIAWLIWLIIPGTAASSVSDGLLIMSGFLLFGSGIALILGAVTVRFGRIGIIALTIFMGTVGAGIGGSAVASQKHNWLANGFIEFRFSPWLVFGGGIIMFIVGAVISTMLIRRLEIRG